jgi:hypothetical protein
MFLTYINTEVPRFHIYYVYIYIPSWAPGKSLEFHRIHVCIHVGRGSRIFRGQGGDM